MRDHTRTKTVGDHNTEKYVKVHISTNKPVGDHTIERHDGIHTTTTIEVKLENLCDEKITTKKPVGDYTTDAGDLSLLY